MHSDTDDNIAHVFHFFFSLLFLKSTSNLVNPIAALLLELGCGSPPYPTQVFVPIYAIFCTCFGVDPYPYSHLYYFAILPSIMLTFTSLFIALCALNTPKSLLILITCK